MTPEKMVVVFERIAGIASSSARGDVVGAIKGVVSLGLDLAPVEILREHLDAEAIARAEAAADAAQRAKFGS